MDSIERSIAHYKTVQELVEWRTRAEQAEARVAALEAENERLREAYRDMRKGESEMRLIASIHKGKQEQAEARVAALEEALAEMGNAMEAGAYDAAWTIRNAALAGTEGK